MLLVALETKFSAAKVDCKSLKAMVSNLIAMASNLEAMASNLDVCEGVKRKM